MQEADGELYMLSKRMKLPTRDRLKPGGRRKWLPAEMLPVPGMQLNEGQRIVLMLEAVVNPEGVDQVALLNYEDILTGQSLSAKFKVNSFEVI